MSKNEDYTIDQVSWHLMTPGNPETKENIKKRFYSVVTFLQDNGLVVRQLAKNLSDIGDEFSIDTADLTEDGLSLMEKEYDKWLRKVDNGMDPMDVTIFQKSLKKIKGI